jgi:hypothetical protein
MVSVRRRLRALACFGLLEVAAVFGMPMRPEQIQELAQLVNESKAQDTLPSEGESGEPPDGEQSHAGAKRNTRRENGETRPTRTRQPRSAR